MIKMRNSVQPRGVKVMNVCFLLKMWAEILIKISVKT